MNVDLKIGDKVELSPDSVYADNGWNNPTNTVGEVVGEGKINGDEWVEVIWDKIEAIPNNYPPQGNDLIKVEE